MSVEALENLSKRSTGTASGGAERILTQESTDCLAEACLLASRSLEVVRSTVKYSL